MDDHWREVVINWRGEMAFEGVSPSGGTVQMGAYEGRPGVSPMELVLVGLGGCTGMDVFSILKKMRANLTDFRVRVKGLRTTEHPKVYTEIQVDYLIWGTNIEPRNVEMAIELSEAKYCSVSAMLKMSANIRSAYRILDVGEPAPLDWLEIA